MVQAPQSHQISGSHLCATITDFGASLTDLRLKGLSHSLVLGYPDAGSYASDRQFMGAVIGRYANRIAGGSAIVKDTAIQLELNENGSNHLHGGSIGYALQYWEIIDHTNERICLQLSSADGDAGYPGNLVVVATYEIASSAILRLTLSARSDADTLINVCHHPYFNLEGSNTIDYHELEIHADEYLPADTALIPTGEVSAVNGTRFDYRSLRTISAGPYNNTYCLHNNASGKLALAGTLKAQDQVMEVWTTQPGLHFYDGYKLSPTSVGHQGHTYSARSGVCLEAQAWPDSPNHPHFPNVSLKKGEKYRQVTEYRFDIG